VEHVFKGRRKDSRNYIFALLGPVKKGGLSGNKKNSISPELGIFYPE